MRATPSGEVVLGIPPMTGTVLTVPVVERFRESFPNVSLRLVEAFDEKIYVSDTVVALRKSLHMRKDEQGFIKVGPIEPGTKLKLPDNPLVREIQAVLKRKKGKEYAEYVAHQFYVDCREMYDHFHAHLDFVANVMPLFGLIGTVIGLIGMFDRLGSNTSIENLSPQLAISLQCTLYGAILASVYMTIASRFDQRIKALEYDYDILVHSLDVLVENGADIEIQA